MRSSQLHLERYDTDKIANHYLERYDPIFMPFVEKKIVMLELGIHKGGSLELWRDYFPNGKIVGIDLFIPKEYIPSTRIHIYEGSQADLQFLSRVANEMAPDGFDIIVDDASHVGSLTKTSFWHLFDNHLKPNGVYVIEDWGTGYWDDWSDGKSFQLDSYTQSQSSFEQLLQKIARRLKLRIPMRNHSYGMVGFVKQLIDEQGAQSATRKFFRSKPERSSKFENVLITPPMIFVQKIGPHA